MNNTDTKKRILELTGTTEEQYAVLVWELGNDYALHLLKSEHVANKLTSTGTYWDWWSNQWEIADAALMNLLDCYRDLPNGSDLKQMWLAEHTPERIRSSPGKYVFSKIKTNQ